VDGVGRRSKGRTVHERGGNSPTPPEGRHPPTSLSKLKRKCGDGRAAHPQQRQDVPRSPRSLPPRRICARRSALSSTPGLLSTPALKWGEHVARTVYLIVVFISRKSDPVIGLGRSVHPGVAIAIGARVCARIRCIVL
jgi:hypothetical protein